jgi:protein-S-isoprenylcysteine O-methyltransferase Ste14
MLPLLVVEISPAVAHFATSVGLVVGILRRRRLQGPVGIVDTRRPAPGTQVLWIVATLVAVFWTVGFFLLPAYAYRWPSVPHFPCSSAVQILGLGLGVGGGVLYALSSRTLGTQMTPLIQIQRGHRLVQEGPYRYVRHPVYAAILMIGIGQSFLFLSLPAALVTAVLIGLAVYRAGMEEDLLRCPGAMGST